MTESEVRVEKVHIGKPEISHRDMNSINRKLYPSEVSTIACTTLTSVPRETLDIPSQTDSFIGLAIK